MRNGRTGLVVAEPTVSPVLDLRPWAICLSNASCARAPRPTPCLMGPASLSSSLRARAAQLEAYDHRHASQEKRAPAAVTLESALAEPFAQGTMISRAL
jgi:hypothetical protein